MKPLRHPVEFRLFLLIWNRLQNMPTPPVHLRIARWLEKNGSRGNGRLLLMAFRSCGKSTLVGLFAAWLLYANPNLRILVLSAERGLARRMVRTVRRILERHPLTQGLKPAHADQWAAERFTITRPQELREPSMAAHGIDSNITGSRADIIICDDVEVPKTCDTTQKRENLREKLAELDFILAPGGTILYAGTPHSWYTLYAATPRTDIGETEPFLAGYTRLTIPVRDESGASTWPERYSPATIAKLESRTGPQKFAAQMLLQPTNITESRLNPAFLRRYNAEPILTRELGRLDLCGRRLVSCSAYWDPAFGHKDGSVLVIVYGDEDANLHLHRVLYLGQTPHTETTDRATAQCREVLAAARALHIPVIAVETNGIGRYLPGILRRELAHARIPCAVREITNTRPKSTRILEAFDAVMAARLLHAHESVFATPFITEMREWRPNKTHARDDGLDAVAGALAMEPMRLRAPRPPAAPTGTALPNTPPKPNLMSDYSRFPSLRVQRSNPEISPPALDCFVGLMASSQWQILIRVFVVNPALQFQTKIRNKQKGPPKMPLPTPDPVWWITAIDLPALTGLFWLIWRTRREAETAIAHLRDILDSRNAQLRESLSAFKLEAAKTYAAINDLRTLEERLVAHLLRIESKLDTTALKTEALNATAKKDRK